MWIGTYRGFRVAKGVGSRRVQPIATSLEHRRGMRGLIYHARTNPQYGHNNSTKRPLVTSTKSWIHDDAYSNVERCNWCQLPTDGFPREMYWHQICYGYYACARAFEGKANRIRRIRRRIVPRDACATCGGSPDTLDHIVPLSLARMRGQRARIRSYLPHNLQWLCLCCADEKSAQDRIVFKECGINGRTTQGGGARQRRRARRAAKAERAWMTVSTIPLSVPSAGLNEAGLS